MKTTSLQFEDILQLLEFVEYTNKHHCAVDYEKIILTGEFSEADIELATQGYKATVLKT